MKYEHGIFHIKDWEGLVVIPTPTLIWGDEVQEIERPQIQGEIIKIQWHYKDNEYKYYISINGRPKSRRYDANELRLRLPLVR